MRQGVDQHADSDTDPNARPYHHGALRAQLIAAGLDLVAAEGVGALSLRRLAREVGVSSGAPYHHFADRAALFAAIVVDGHDLLFSRLDAVRAGSSDAVAALRELLVAYASFAADHSAHMRVMLRPELAEPAVHPEVTAAGARPIELLRSTVLAAQDEGAVPPGDPEPVLHMIWSLAVGYVTLWLDGPVEARCTALGTTPDEMIRRVASTVEALLRRPRA
ncbi:TetR/AcrR family transcriptional regulator [Candidatus Frankia alpina]|uniref:TetR/AcrR family transcriptional regulator n=1 Tax=Candidatus Frankia alpina TaxID=2699483 RepID=A0A4S5ETG8_9ACTN|nr:TetR/AcrR family transcriptional regulator [Candidatus Frankia alpina]THJ75771.1 TetR/AcrR family transcriptional regulator [Candidatus Frankia alpina]